MSQGRAGGPPAPAPGGRGRGSGGAGKGRGSGGGQGRGFGGAGQGRGGKAGPGGKPGPGPRHGRGDRGDAPASRRIVVGLHPIREVLRAGQRLDEILIASGRSDSAVLDDIASLARRAGVPVRHVDRNRIDGLAEGLVHQGVVAVGPPFPYASMDQVVARAQAAGEPLFCVIADGVTDPHNLGAIARTAEGLGVHGLIIPSRRAAGVTPTVEKAAAGALAHLPLVQVSNVSSAIRTLKKLGVWIIGLEAGDSDMISASPLLGQPLAIVVGSEGQGLAHLSQIGSDALVHLPMVGQVTSYNASVAVALALYEVRRHRMEAERPPA